MADQVEIEIPKSIYNEGTQFTATVRFRTRSSKAASVPTTAHYKITNLSTNKVVRDWTALTAAAEISFTIAPTDNDIDDKTHLQERMELLVAADRGMSTQSIGSRHYKIRDLDGYG